MSAKSIKVKRLGILGGTFDPPHNRSFSNIKICDQEIKTYITFVGSNKKKSTEKISVH